MMLSHCMVAAMWQVAPLLTMDALFLEQGALCKWLAAKGGSSGFQIGSTTFLLHFRWYLLHSSPPRKLLSSSEFIVSQVLFILFTPSALWGRSCAVSYLCLLRQRELKCTELLQLLQLAVTGCGLSVLHRGKQCSRQLSVEALWNAEVCLPQSLWPEPLRQLCNSCSPPVFTKVVPRTWCKITHMPVFKA